MIVLFLGGPRDGHRIQLTNEIIRRGVIEVAGEMDEGRSVPIHTYNIISFAEGSGCDRNLYPVAVHTDIKSPIQTLMQGYKKS